jgi:hypothetical protein
MDRHLGTHFDDSSLEGWLLLSIVVACLYVFVHLGVCAYVVVSGRRCVFAVDSHSHTHSLSLSFSLLSELQSYRVEEGTKKKKYRISDRKSIEEIYEAIDSQIHLTFDFLSLVISAALIAAIGIVHFS